jgi:hypothetical protein
MINTTAPKWARTTGANLLATRNDKDGSHVAEGRKFRIAMPDKNRKPGKTTLATFKLVKLDRTISNDKFTLALIRNEDTGETFWNRIQNNTRYWVPVNQK